MNLSFEDIIAKLPKPYYRDDAVVIYYADCRLVLPLIPDKSIDLVLTDPPYPDNHPEYGDSDISFLNSFSCRQLIFWSAKTDFPLDYTAIHIWDKQNSEVCSYERIFERNGKANYRLFSHDAVNSVFWAKRYFETFTGHPSQKPIEIIAKLIANFSENNTLILDPFLGSGTTAYCAKKLGRKCVGIEIEERYCHIAAQRCAQMVLPLESEQVKQGAREPLMFQGMSG